MRYVTIEPRHVGRSLFPAFGRRWLVQNFIGRILPDDVGKRVYLCDGILQVENDKQRAKRLGVDDDRA